MYNYKIVQFYNGADFMKRRLLIAVFFAMFVIGVLFSLNRVPEVDIGQITIVYDNTETEINGKQTATYRKSERKESKDLPDIMDLKDSMTSFNQQIAENNSSNTIKIGTDISVNYYGRVHSSYYTIYDLNGNIVEDNLTELNLPVNETNGCIVKTTVQWGRENNYCEYAYYFKVNYVL